MLSTRQSMFVKHVPPLWAYFKEATNYKANISRTITLPKFVQLELSPHMHFLTCSATSLPSFTQIHARMYM